LELIITEDKLQVYYEVAERLRQSVYTLFKKPDLDQDKVEVMISMFDNLCNALAIELYLHPILEDLDIHIFQYWKEVIDTIKDQNNTDLLIKELTSQDSPLRNQMMKLYMYATQISNKVK
jgi:molybdopterin/thiamine biosynthesis adenylyltransferase